VHGTGKRKGIERIIAVRIEEYQGVIRVEFIPAAIERY
jgi:hypothetical protein